MVDAPPGPYSFWRQASSTIQPVHYAQPMMQFTGFLLIVSSNFKGIHSARQRLK
jgi:hypothetical protein